LHHWAGQALIPEDTDNVTASFSSDDFSSLNKFSKALEDKGEPGSIFRDISSKDRYLWECHECSRMAEKFANWRAKIDVRNIRGHIEQADFYIKIDTKMHCLLHTRNSLDCPAKIEWASSTWPHHVSDDHSIFLAAAALDFDWDPPPLKH